MTASAESIDVRAGCPDDAALARFVEGEGDGPSRAAIEAHLDDCPACGDLLAAFGQTFGPRSSARGRVATPSAGRYVLGDEIGRGGMGIVYAAVDPILDRPIAVKAIAPIDGVPRETERLLREARAMARIAHPNVVAVYDAVVDRGEVFLAMELVAGKSLRSVLTTPPLPSIERRLALFRDAARGLAAAHAANVVHRDFKPENVLVGATGARVTDFGLARPSAGEVPAVAGPPLSVDVRWAGEVTTRGVHGTPPYLSPEQIDRRPVGTASDQWSFGVALYEAVYGANPFDAATAESLAVLRSRMDAGPRLPATRAHPAWLWNVVRRCLALDPAARWSSMAEVATLLEGPDPTTQRRLVALTAWLRFGVAAHLVLAVFLVVLFLAPGEEVRYEGVFDAVMTAVGALWLVGGFAAALVAARGVRSCRRSAYGASIVYAFLSLPTLVGTPFGIAMLYLLTRSGVRQAFGRGPAPIVAAAVLGAALAGCAGEPASPPPATPSAPVAPVVPPARCALATKEGVTAPPIATLRALIGKRADDPAVAAVTGALGEVRVGHAQNGALVRSFGDAGVEISFWEWKDAAPVVADVRLAGRVDRLAHYAPSLPADLAFTMSRAEVEAKIGRPDADCTGYPMCVYSAQGVVLAYARECLAAVSLVHPVASDEVRYEALRAGPETVGGETGITVAFAARRGKGAIRTEHALRLETSAGAPVSSRIAELRDGTKPGFVQRVSASLSGWQSIFVPFRALDLPAGHHALRVRLASRELGASTAHADPIDLRASDDAFPIDVDLPSVRLVRVGVKSVEVEPGEYDDITRNRVIAGIATGGASLLVDPAIDAKKLARPDLTWSVAIGVQRYRAPAFQDTFRASWAQASTPFPLAPDDVVSVCIGDEDIPRTKSAPPLDEEIGCVKGTVTQLEAWARDGKAPVTGKIRALVLARPQ